MQVRRGIFVLHYARALARIPCWNRILRESRSPRTADRGPRHPWWLSQGRRTVLQQLPRTHGPARCPGNGCVGLRHVSLRWAAFKFFRSRISRLRPSATIRCKPRPNHVPAVEASGIDSHRAPSVRPRPSGATRCSARADTAPRGPGPHIRDGGSGVGCLPLDSSFKLGSCHRSIRGSDPGPFPEFHPFRESHGFPQATPQGPDSRFLAQNEGVPDESRRFGTPVAGRGKRKTGTRPAEARPKVPCTARDAGCAPLLRLRLPRPQSRRKGNEEGSGRDAVTRRTIPLFHRCFDTAAGGSAALRNVAGTRRGDGRIRGHQPR